MIAALAGAGVALAIYHSGRTYTEKEPEKRGGYVPASAIQNAIDSTVQIKTSVDLEEKVFDSSSKVWLGTGLVLQDSQTKDFYVLTAEHVTADEMYMEKSKGKTEKVKVHSVKMEINEHEAIVMKEDEKLDIALLKLDQQYTGTYFHRKVANQLYPGDYIIGVGFPKEEKEDLFIKEIYYGRVQKTTGTLTILDLTVIGGTSGSVALRVYDKDLSMAGIVKNTKGITPLEDLHSFLKGTPLEDEYL
ncbi:MAG TPA: serine protease [Candidatus Nanoarchaeia archaeon]|nr:serine protease [Candidatus Nanoarchaeia archaeon]